MSAAPSEANHFGRLSENHGFTSSRSTVPVAVPSLNQSSRPVTVGDVRSAVNRQPPGVATRLVTSRGAPGASGSAILVVPAGVPSLRQNALRMLILAVPDGQVC